MYVSDVYGLLVGLWFESLCALRQEMMMYVASRIRKRNLDLLLNDMDDPYSKFLTAYIFFFLLELPIFSMIKGNNEFINFIYTS